MGSGSGVTNSLGVGSGVGSGVGVNNHSGVTLGVDLLFGSDLGRGIFIVDILLALEKQCIGSFVDRKTKSH
jgi:hypothetical protein